MKPIEKIRLLALVKKLKLTSAKHYKLSRKFYSKEETSLNYEDDRQRSFNLSGKGSGLNQASNALLDLIEEFDERKTK